MFYPPLLQTPNDTMAATFPAKHDSVKGSTRFSARELPVSRDFAGIMAQ
jgi:hypothetical protein